MKTLLEQSIHHLITGNIEEAKSHFKTYMELKSRKILEDSANTKDEDKDLVKGHCDDCGEDVATTEKIIDSGKWMCPKCESKKFVKD